jgi:hypothetical protein
MTAEALSGLNPKIFCCFDAMKASFEIAHDFFLIGDFPMPVLDGSVLVTAAKLSSAAYNGFPNPLLNYCARRSLRGEC